MDRLQRRDSTVVHSARGSYWVPLRPPAGVWVLIPCGSGLGDAAVLVVVVLSVHVLAALALEVLSHPAAFVDLSSLFLSSLGLLTPAPALYLTTIVVTDAASLAPEWGGNDQCSEVEAVDAGHMVVAEVVVDGAEELLLVSSLPVWGGHDQMAG